MLKSCSFGSQVGTVCDYVQDSMTGDEWIFAESNYSNVGYGGSGLFLSLPQQPTDRDVQVR